MRRTPPSTRAFRSQQPGICHQIDRAKQGCRVSMTNGIFAAEKGTLVPPVCARRARAETDVPSVLHPLDGPKALLTKVELTLVMND